MGKDYKKKLRLRKRFLIPVIVLGAFLLSLFVYVSASSSLSSDIAKVDDGWLYKVYGNIGLRWPDSSTDSLSLFVPTKTDGEWNSFLSQIDRLGVETCTSGDGGWSDWNCESCKADASPYAVCDSWMECGTVTATDYYDRKCTRSCTNPSPVCGGSSCGLDDSKTVECSDEVTSESCGSCPGECEFCTGNTCELSDSACAGCCTCASDGDCTCTDPYDSCGTCLWCSGDGTCETCQDRHGDEGYDHVWCENDACYGADDACDSDSDCFSCETCGYHDGDHYKTCKDLGDKCECRTSSDCTSPSTPYCNILSNTCEECTQNAHCPEGVCTNGHCTTDECSTTSDCGLCSWCIDGECKSCEERNAGRYDNAWCIEEDDVCNLADDMCDADSCHVCQTCDYHDGDHYKTCKDLGDKCECMIGDDCSSSTPYCDLFTNTCVECTQDAHCSGGECTENHCCTNECASDGDCGTYEECTIGSDGCTHCVSTEPTDGCFTENQLVLTSEGYKKIKDIKEGEIVISYDEEKEIFGTSIVGKLMVHNGKDFLLHNFEKSSLIKLYFEDNEEIKTIKVTENHPYFDPINQEYKHLKEFEEGDLIKTLNGEGVIKKKEALDLTPVVYNLEMKDGPRNYIVNGAVVHNGGDSGDTK